MTDGFATAGYPWHVVLRIRASPEHIRAHLPGTVARLDPLDGPAPRLGEPWYRAEIHVQNLDWLPTVIAALDRPVRVEQPEELRDLRKTTATRMLRAADDTLP